MNAALIINGPEVVDGEANDREIAPAYSKCNRQASMVVLAGLPQAVTDRAAWRVFGNIPYRDEPEVESGQIVIDKARCWRALTFANWCGERSAFFFQHVYGDKELFHLCWRKSGRSTQCRRVRFTRCR